MVLSKLLDVTGYGDSCLFVVKDLIFLLKNAFGFSLYF